MDKVDEKPAIGTFGAIAADINGIQSPATPEEAFEHPPLDVKRQILLKRLSESLNTLSQNDLLECRSDLHVIQSTSQIPPKKGTTSNNACEIPISTMVATSGIDPHQLLSLLAAQQSQFQHNNSTAPPAHIVAALQNTLLTNKFAASNPAFFASSLPYFDMIASNSSYQRHLVQQCLPVVRQQHTVTPHEHLVGIYGEYQPYCHQIITEDLNKTASKILSIIKDLQSSDSFNASQIGGFRGRRYFCSLKEVSKVVHKARLLIVAPNVRPSHLAQIKPVHVLERVLSCADAAGVPYVFALSRKGIGQVFGKDKNMSIVAVMGIDQIEQDFAMLLEQSRIGREVYSQLYGSRGRAAGLPHHVFNTAPSIDGRYSQTIVPQHYSMSNPQSHRALHVHHTGVFHPNSSTASTGMLAINHPPPAPVVPLGSHASSTSIRAASYV